MCSIPNFANCNLIMSCPKIKSHYYLHMCMFFLSFLFQFHWVSTEAYTKKITGVLAQSDHTHHCTFITFDVDVVRFFYSNMAQISLRGKCM